MTQTHRRRSWVVVEVDDDLRTQAADRAAKLSVSLEEFVRNSIEHALIHEFDQFASRQARETKQPEESDRFQQPQLSETLAILNKFREEYRDTHGKLFPESWELLEDARDERTSDHDDLHAS